MKRCEVDRSKLAPMMAKYMEIKDNYEDTIIFFRLGDFYEMFFEDAETVSKELSLTLTGRQAGLSERVPMCGVPYHAYQSYVSKLIDKGYKVAICEQLTDPKESKGMVERDIVQVITRGTLLDNLNYANEFNYIASIYAFKDCYAFTYADISTGDIYSIILKDEESLYRELINLSIKEVIVNSEVNREILYNLKNNYNILITITDEVEEYETYDYIYSGVNDLRLITSIKHLLTYITKTKKTNLKYLKKVVLNNENDHLIFDYHTKKNLELTETIRDNSRNNSLLWLMDKTKTAMGSRLLKQNLVSPFTNLDLIERRFNYIDSLRKNFLVKENLTTSLNEIYDLERLIGRISYGNLNARDMYQLLKSLDVLPSIKEELIKINYDKNLETLDELTDLLRRSINPNAPLTLKEGGLILDGFDEELDKLRKIKNNSQDFILLQEEEERRKTGIKNLKIGYNKVFGYYIEVSKGSISQVKPEYGYIRKQTLTTGERYINEALKEKEQIIEGASEKIINLEYELFSNIRLEVNKYTSKIQEVSSIISEIDLLISLATIADKYNLVRPTFNNNHEIKIIEGRHPVVEAVNKVDYVPNDIIMDDCDCLLITGPNMAGKSTYMRQLAIIVIMAQIGSFVPCKSCSIPIFDKIFTRIGASDDLVSGESTFMVEMKEANYALTNATKNSLILFDELGRGTATYDGMSLAYAILEYIHNTIHAKTLFSTHYHELTTLCKNLKRVKNVHVSALEENGNITFLHKVVEGAVSKSYGINVASLAKLPESVIKKAEEVLNTYETKPKKALKTEVVQTSFNFEPTPSKVEEKLKAINIMEITPLDALNLLNDLKKEL
ncbi:MAG: DNA mismatch repair protein MutS [Erysipelotrichaceae bacterium]|nr:DNA mismatch repair protein MutS [Erysipelotrichaceae bacterium]